MVDAGGIESAEGTLGPPASRRRRRVVVVSIVVALVAAGALAWLTYGYQRAAAIVKAQDGRDAHYAELMAAQEELSESLESAAILLIESEGRLVDDRLHTELAEQISRAMNLPLLEPEPLWSYSKDELEALRMQDDDLLVYIEKTGQAQVALAAVTSAVRATPEVSAEAG